MLTDIFNKLLKVTSIPIILRTDVKCIETKVQFKDIYQIKLICTFKQWVLEA